MVAMNNRESSLSTKEDSRKGTQSRVLEAVRKGLASRSDYCQLQMPFRGAVGKKKSAWVERGHGVPTAFPIPGGPQPKLQTHSVRAPAAEYVSSCQHAPAKVLLCLLSFCCQRTQELDTLGTGQCWCCRNVGCVSFCPILLPGLSFSDRLFVLCTEDSPGNRHSQGRPITMRQSNVNPGSSFFLPYGLPNHVHGSYLCPMHMSCICPISGYS